MTVSPFTTFSPGRINLIGEHTDYNGGLVLPMPLGMGIRCEVVPNGKKEITCVSRNFEGGIRIDFTEEIKPSAEKHWTEYVKGLVNTLISQGYSLKGADITFDSDLPSGAGLSSSASLLVALGKALIRDYLETEDDLMSLALMCQYAEKNFVGVNCGVMDQIASAIGKPGHALALHCDSLGYRHIGAQLAGYKIMVMHSGKKRTLADSVYNQRVAECNEALHELRKHVELKTLSDASEDLIKKHIDDAVLAARARHVVTENARVSEACDALEKGDVAHLGKLMMDSHASLKTDYEVTGFELDTIVEAAVETNGCAGARMTGAGFGGCAIALVEESETSAFKKRVSELYIAKTGLVPQFYTI